MNAGADAFFTVSLADSLFFNVSVEAARPRLLLYLLITMAPFVVLAPLIGPFVDRVRGGQRTVGYIPSSSLSKISGYVGLGEFTVPFSKTKTSEFIFFF